MPTAETTTWRARAIWIVLIITLARLVLLRFNKTDLFVDESQYWLWSYELAFGYYSKPPLIAWVIHAATSIGGSNGTFWVRLAAPVFHGATALILAAMAARMLGARAAVWVAVSYATLPMVALGSLLISTDTIMAPFFAAALYFHLRLTETRAWRFAAAAGVAIGLAFLAKYAAVYFLLGVGLGALLITALRIGWGNAAVLLAAFGLVISPNVIWNLTHDLATVGHTMDNVGWVRDASPWASVSVAEAAEFLAAQFAVFGPVLFAALLWVAAKRPAGSGRLLVFVLPPLVIVTVQALLSGAYANWAASAYFAGTVAVVAVLLQRHWLLVVSLLVNGAICLALPVLTLMPGVTLGRDEPLLSRYIGRVYMTRQILSLAEVENVPVVSDRRDILAELFHTGGGIGLRYFAVPPHGRPQNYFEQLHALPPGRGGRVLLVTTTPPVCDGAEAVPAIVFDTVGGAYSGEDFRGYLIAADCLDVAR